MAAGIATPRAASDRRSTRRSACSKDCWSTRGRRVRRLTSPALAFADRNICSSAACSDRDRPDRSSPSIESSGARGVDAVFVSHALALRHPVGARLPAAGRRRARRAHGRGDRSGGEEARRDGRWPLENPHPGPVHFEMEGGAGEPSRWNTLRALRVVTERGSARTRAVPVRVDPPGGRASLRRRSGRQTASRWAARHRSMPEARTSQAGR